MYGFIEVYREYIKKETAVCREEYNVDDKHTNCVSVPKITLKQLLDAPKTSADAKHQNGVFVAKITLK